MILTHADVEEIIGILDQTPHDELHLRTDRFELRLSRTGEGWTQETRSFSHTQAPAVPVAEPVPARKDADLPGLTSIRAPMVGTFYRAPKPGAPPFVEVGAEVEPHGVIGIIETMKLMNAISADAAGVVTEILAANGVLVEAGQILMRVKPHAP